MKDRPFANLAERSNGHLVLSTWISSRTSRTSRINRSVDAKIMLVIARRLRKPRVFQSFPQERTSLVAKWVSRDNDNYTYSQNRY